MSQPQARIHARIAGTGSYLPERVLTNDDLAKMVDTSDEWIATRTGIRERHIAAEGETTSDLGYRAALRALEAWLDGGPKPDAASLQADCGAQGNPADDCRFIVE